MYSTALEKDSHGLSERQFKRMNIKDDHMRKMLYPMTRVEFDFQHETSIIIIDKLVLNGIIPIPMIQTIEIIKNFPIRVFRIFLFLWSLEFFHQDQLWFAEHSDPLKITMFLHKINEKKMEFKEAWSNNLNPSVEEFVRECSDFYVAEL